MERTADEILDDHVNAYDYGAEDYSRDGAIEARWHEASTTNQRLILEVLLDIREKLQDLYITKH